MPAIDDEKCVRCGRCVADCTTRVIEEREGKLVFAYPEACISCYHCVAVCPAGAVTCDDFPLDEFSPAAGLEPPAPELVENLLLSRRSVRVFADEPVPRAALEKLVRIGSHAPTGSNAQCVELTVVTDREFMDRMDREVIQTFTRLVGLVGNPLAKAAAKLVAPPAKRAKIDEYVTALKRFGELGDEARPIFRGAPALILAHSGSGASTGKDDCVIALSHIMFAANSMGLGATWIGLVVAAARLNSGLKSKFRIPRQNKLHAAIILGRPRYEYPRLIPREPVKTAWIE